jgi:hypothetical protein
VELSIGEKMTFQLSVQIGDEKKDFMTAAQDTEEAIAKVKAFLAEQNTEGRVLTCRAKASITLV